MELIEKYKAKRRKRKALKRVQQHMRHRRARPRDKKCDICCGRNCHIDRSKAHTVSPMFELHARDLPSWVRVVGPISAENVAYKSTQRA